jgi:SAM-dependent methyltransferase
LDLGRQNAYWDSVDATKAFTHPVNVSWLAGVTLTAWDLGYGCGYGRVIAELSEHGFLNISGVDLSPALIERARHLRRGLRVAVLESPLGAMPGT